MAPIVSGLTPGFNTKMDKLLVVSACLVTSYAGSRRREMRFRKYKMVEVQGIEPWSERVHCEGPSSSKLHYTPEGSAVHDRVYHLPNCSRSYSLSFTSP